MGAVAEAIAGAFQAYGGELRRDAGVEQILVKSGKVKGVALTNGEEIDARIVVSGMDVKRTFLKCMDKNDLPAEFYHRVKNFKIRGSSGKLNIALDGMPSFPALPRGSPLLHGDMHFIDSMERMERMTTGKKAPGPGTPTSTWSYRPSATQRWHRRANTS
jgi:phytoene dehydrogenase-like protein